jgi:hypothetical protein
MPGSMARFAGFDVVGLQQIFYIDHFLVHALDRHADLATIEHVGLGEVTVSLQQGEKPAIVLDQADRLALAHTLTMAAGGFPAPLALAI